MIDIMEWILVFSVSAAFIALYYIVDLLFFRQKPDLISLLIGLGPVALISYVAETYLYTLSFNLVLSLLFIAPIIEELTKFSATFYGKQTRNGLGVGLGFALTENALYFHTFFSMYSLSMVIIPYIILRGPCTSSFFSSLVFVRNFIPISKTMISAAIMGYIYMVSSDAMIIAAKL